MENKENKPRGVSYETVDTLEDLAEKLGGAVSALLEITGTTAADLSPHDTTGIALVYLAREIREITARITKCIDEK